MIMNRFPPVLQLAPFSSIYSYPSSSRQSNRAGCNPGTSADLTSLKDTHSDKFASTARVVAVSFGDDNHACVIANEKGPIDSGDWEIWWIQDTCHRRPDTCQFQNTSLSCPHIDEEKKPILRSLCRRWTRAGGKSRVGAGMRRVLKVNVKFVEEEIALPRWYWPFFIIY